MVSWTHQRLINGRLMEGFAAAAAFVSLNSGPSVRLHVPLVRSKPTQTGIVLSPCVYESTATTSTVHFGSIHEYGRYHKASLSGIS
jgi:hypothetical protein